MNWDQYFKLKEQRRKHLWIIFIILVLISLLQIKNDVKDLDAVCGRINISCYAPETALIDDTFDNSIELNETVSGELIEKKPFKDYVWFECEFDCDLTTSDQVLIWRNKFTYTPLFIAKDLVFAYILSLVIYFYKTFKLEHEKGEKESTGEKEESKDKGKK